MVYNKAQSPITLKSWVDVLELGRIGIVQMSWAIRISPRKLGCDIGCLSVWASSPVFCVGCLWLEVSRLISDQLVACWTRWWAGNEAWTCTGNPCYISIAICCKTWNANSSIVYLAKRNAFTRTPNKRSQAVLVIEISWDYLFLAKNASKQSN